MMQVAAAIVMQILEFFGWYRYYRKRMKMRMLFVPLLWLALYVRNSRAIWLGLVCVLFCRKQGTKKRKGQLIGVPT